MSKRVNGYLRALAKNKTKEFHDYQDKLKKYKKDTLKKMKK